MKGNEQVIGILNQVLRKELTGINQYFIHAKMCQNWGYERLYKVLWEESMGEMKHADQIIERINSGVRRKGGDYGQQDHIPGWELTSPEQRAKYRRRQIEHAMRGS